MGVKEVNLSGSDSLKIFLTSQEEFQNLFLTLTDFSHRIFEFYHLSFHRSERFSISYICQCGHHIFTILLMRNE